MCQLWYYMAMAVSVMKMKWKPESVENNILLMTANEAYGNS